MLMFAVGAPALIGSAGMAVDVAQWYLWKRELQYAADQAALAGAYARASLVTTALYQSRATQDFAANLSITDKIAAAPTVTLGNYGTGLANKITVEATATSRLPFSGMFTRGPTTVRVRSSAVFKRDEGWTSCILAIDKVDAKTLWINGGPDIRAGCGIAALSNSAKAIELSGGSGVLDLGWIVSAGGVDSDFEDGHTTIKRYQTAMFDPFQDVTPPSGSSVPRTVDCTIRAPTYTGLYSITKSTVTRRYEGTHQNALSLVSTSVPTTSTSNETAATLLSAVVGTTTTTVDTSTTDAGSNTVGTLKTYYRVDTTVTVTRTLTTVTEDSGTGSSGVLQPGTYSNFDINNKTCLMAPGVYVIDGGSINLHASGSSLTGTGVTFVLKNGATIDITGGNVSLTGMDKDDLVAGGMSSGDAETLDDVLFIEDKTNPASVQHTLTGNATSVFNGTVYLPKSSLTMLGTFSVTSACLMIAAKTVQLGGSLNFASACPPGLEKKTYISNQKVDVHLVA